MERIGHTDRTRTPVCHDGVDEVGPIGGHVGDLGAAVFTKEVEELTHRGAGAARRGPHQPALVVVDDDHQVLVALLVADLVDPDPPQTRQAVVFGVDVGPDPADDRSDGAPGDPHQLGDRGLRSLGRQPRHLLIEGVGMAGIVTCPRHRGDYHPVLAAGHPWCVGLQHHIHRAQVQRPPTPTPCAGVVARAASTTDSAPATLPLGGSHRGDQQFRVLVELDPLDHGLLDAQQAPP